MRQTAAEAKIEDLAVRYCELAALVDDASKTKDKLAAQIKGWLEESGESELDIEGLPILKLQRATNYTYDVQAIAESQPILFKRLMQLGCLDISRTKLKAHQEDIAMKVPAMEGETVRLVRVKR